MKLTPLATSATTRTDAPLSRLQRTMLLVLILFMAALCTVAPTQAHQVDQLVVIGDSDATEPGPDEYPIEAPQAQQSIFLPTIAR